MRITWPVHRNCFHEESLDATDLTTFKYTGIGNHFLSSGIGYFPRTYHVELIELQCMMSVQFLAAIQKSCENNSSVDSDLGWTADPMIVPWTLSESAKSSTSLSQSVTNIVINARIRRQNTAEVTEFIHNLEDSFSIRTLWLEWWHKLLSIPALGWAFPIRAESAVGLWQYCAWWDPTVGRGNSYMGQPPFVAEVRCTIQQMSSGKSPSAGSIPSEMRSTSMAVNNCLNVSRNCERTWDQEAVPQDFKDARIVHIQVEGKQGLLWQSSGNFTTFHCRQDYCPCRT